MLSFELSNFCYFPYVHAYGKYSNILFYIILYILHTIFGYTTLNVSALHG